MRIFSGIQPTGTIHLGNYFGALTKWVDLQNDGNECFFSIVNQHAITLPQNPQELSKNILHVAATLIAVGVDPEKSTLFVQSDIAEHIQLAWILTCLAPMGLMERMIQFKEKSEKKPQSINLGLFSYPVLQAADIILYKAEAVPVGKDQAQHLELTRELVQKFNNRFSPIFPEPKTLFTKTEKIVGLDGTAKMSKSLDNYIGLTESSETIWKKLRTAATDPARVKRSDPGNPNICNIFKLHQLFSERKEIDYVEDGCKTAKIGCIDCKEILFKRIDAHLKPIRDRYETLMSKPDELQDILFDGAKKARAVARETLREVYDAVGFSYR